jgi:hypothetical protein
VKFEKVFVDEGFDCLNTVCSNLNSNLRVKYGRLNANLVYFWMLPPSLHPTTGSLMLQLENIAYLTLVDTTVLKVERQYFRAKLPLVPPFSHAVGRKSGHQGV